MRLIIMTFRALPLTIIALTMFSPSLFAADPAMHLNTEKDKISYSIGLDIGRNFTKQGIDLDTNVFISGLEDGRQNKNTLMTDQEIRDTLSTLQTKLIKQQQENLKKIGQANLLEGKAFLEKNQKAPGVKTLSSGLQYRVITEGQGTPPSTKDTVKTHYKGRLINGAEFDSSYTRGEPVEFPVEGVIKGWTEALQLMKPGSKWEIFVPANLAYGETGAGNVIGPNATLIFEIELLSIAKKNNNNADKPKSAKTTRSQS